MSTHHVSGHRLKNVKVPQNSIVLLIHSIRDGLEVIGSHNRFMVWKEPELMRVRRVPGNITGVVMLSTNMDDGYRALLDRLAPNLRTRSALFRYAYSLDELRETLTHFIIEEPDGKATRLQIVEDSKMAFVDAVPLWVNPKHYDRMFNGCRMTAPIDKTNRGVADVGGRRSGDRRLIDWVCQELVVNDNRPAIQIATTLIEKAKTVFPRTTIRTLAMKIEEARQISSTAYIRY